MWGWSDGTLVERSLVVGEVVLEGLVGEDPAVLVQKGRYLAPHWDQDGVLVLPQLRHEVPRALLLPPLRFVRLEGLTGLLLDPE